MEPLAYFERPAGSKPAGLLVLRHGRGTDERDLLGLADALDPERRLRVVTPRAPLSLPGSPSYRESDVGQIDPAHLADATAWLGETLPG